MKRFLKNFAVLSLIASTAVVSTTPAIAATFNISTSVTSNIANSCDLPICVLSEFEDKTSTDLSPLSSGLTASINTDGDFGNLGNAGFGQADATVDGRTGEIKLYNVAAAVGDDGFGVGARSFGKITESFTVSGTGTFLAQFEIDAFWEFQSSDQVFASVTVGSSNGILLNLGEDSFDFQAATTNNGSIANQILSTGVVFEEEVSGAIVNVEWTFFGYSSADSTFGEGLRNSSFFNGLNTGTANFGTSGGLLAAPSDSQFLSNSVFGQVAPVPLPAAGLLLAGALGGLGLMRRRKKF